MVKARFFNKIMNQKKPSGSLMFLAIIFVLSIVLYFVFKNTYIETLANIKDDDRKKVIYFFRENCPHCVKFSPIWDTFVSEGSFDTKAVVTYKIDATEIPAFLKDNNLDLKIDGYPTIVLLDSKNKNKFITLIT